MNRIYQGKVTNAEIAAPHIRSASIPFSASDREMPLAHRMGEGGRRLGEGLRQPDEVFLESGERTEMRCRNQNPWLPSDPDPKQDITKWQAAHPVPSKPGEDGWHQHQLFQDAVNCYTFALAALPEGANANFAFTGYVDPTEPLRDEGPFGDHTGYYTLPEPYPFFHVTAITHRKDAVYPATIVGIPPMEDFYIGGASVKLFLPIFKMNFPEIVDIALPAEGVFHNLVFVSIRKTYPMQAYKIMHGLWGMGQMMFTKYLVVVDDDVDVHKTSEVLFRLCANTDPQRDSIFIKGPSDVLDHATSEIASGSKLGIDATKKIPGEGFKRPWPPLIKMDESVKARMAKLFNL